MPGTLKKIEDLSMAQQQIDAALAEQTEKAKAILDSGDQLGAAKMSKALLDLKALSDVNKNKIQTQRETIKSKLADGRFLTDDLTEIGATLPTDSKGIYQKASKYLSAQLGAEFDYTAGSGFEERKNLAFIRPENKQEYLSNKYGPENVTTVTLMGNPVTLIRDEQGKFSPVDEFDTTLMDFVDASGEVAPTIGSLIGGAASAIASRSPAMTATGSATGYTLFGSAQDQIARNLFKVGDNFINSVPRRATEAAIGVPIEYGTLKLGRPIVTAIGKAVKGQTTERAKLLNKAEEIFAESGYKTNLAVIGGGTLESQNKRMRAAQRLPNSALGRDIMVGTQRIKRFLDDNIKPGELKGVLSDDAMKLLRAEHQLLVDHISIHNKEIGMSLKNLLDEQTRRMVTDPTFDPASAQKYLYSVVEQSKVAAQKAKDAIYTPFYQKANQAVSVNPKELADVLEAEYISGVNRPKAIQDFINNIRQRTRNEGIKTELEVKLRNGEIQPEFIEETQREINRLREISGPLNAQQLDDTYRELRDLAPTGPLAGSGEGQLKRKVGTVSNSFKEFRDEQYRRAGLWDEWRAASEAMDNFGQFTQGTLSGILEREVGGAVKMSSEEMANFILKNPERIQEVFNVIGRNNPQNLTPFMGSMQSMYLQKIGLAGKSRGATPGFTFDPQTVRYLYGHENPRKGDLMVDKLEKLQQYFKAQKLDPSKVTRTDVANLEMTFSKDSIDKLVGEIGKRVDAEQKLETFVKNTLLKDAELGHVEAISRAEFSKALFSARPDQAKKIFSKFPAREQKSMRDAYAEYLFSKYPGSPDTTIGRYDLFDGETFIRDIKQNPQILENVKAVLGDDFAKTMVAAARLEPITQTTTSPSRMRITGVATQGDSAGEAVKARAFAPIQAIADMIGDRKTALLYSSGKLLPLLRNISQKELTPEAYNKAVNTALISSLFTAQGLQAALSMGKYDPEYSSKLGSWLGTMGKKQLDFEAEYGMEKRGLKSRSLLEAARATSGVMK